MTPAKMADLHARCFETPRPWSEAEFTALIADPAIRTTSQTHGFALVREVMDEAELLTIAVDPNQRRQGIASDLINKMVAKLTATKLFLEVAQNNHGAIAFYKEHCFKQIADRPNYYRHPNGSRIDALIFEKHL
ncbi:MAG: GNAT family N-acetyltransferase [Pseudomonadota bacterium]